MVATGDEAKLEVAPDEEGILLQVQRLLGELGADHHDPVAIGLVDQLAAIAMARKLPRPAFLALALAVGARSLQLALEIAAAERRAQDAEAGRPAS